VVNGVAYAGDIDGSNVYAYSAAGTNCSGTPRTCTALRTYDTGDTSINTAPTVANGVVYASGPFNHSPGLDAFSASGTTNCSGTPKSCALLWTAATGSYINASPAVANEVVYVAAGTNPALRLQRSRQHKPSR
jgi:outer membrane protein assembly factor BamB